MDWVYWTVAIFLKVLGAMTVIGAVVYGLLYLYAKGFSH
ncbi:hypothetical protein LCGC14_2516830 [marine sediment metagenome]|uniref:Uncharacterized protein n=1 Tax=marine sediment metagenome TaxID=412755 RepID=A0A0F9BKI5_9ZZZZ